jgi:hypothetical protein
VLRKARHSYRKSPSEKSFFDGLFFEKKEAGD